MDEIINLLTPCVASVLITVPVAFECRWSSLSTGIFTGGLYIVLLKLF